MTSEPSRTPDRQYFTGVREDCHYAGAIESPPGYWFVRCTCGWSMRSLGSLAQARNEHSRHEQGLEWWEGTHD